LDNIGESPVRQVAAEDLINEEAPPALVHLAPDRLEKDGLNQEILKRPDAGDVERRQEHLVDGRPLGLGGRVAPPGLTRETEPSDTTESCLSFVICWAFSGGYLSGEAVRSADRARARGQCAARVGQGLAAEARRTDAQR
jgi:hypothetical protein